MAGCIQLAHQVAKMNTYASSALRNVAVVGHAHCGKTSLITAMLRAAKVPAALERSESEAVTAYDEEELARHMTMSNAVAFAEWNGVKLNLLDTPGFHMFMHELRSAMLPMDATLVIVNAQTGIEAVTEQAWKLAAEASLPRVVVVTQIDHPKAQSGDPMKIIHAMRDKWGRQIIPVQLPIVDDTGFRGVADLVTMEAFYYTPGGDGRGTSGKMPAAMEASAKAAHEALVELVAEGKDELMEEFFALGSIPEEHLVAALHEAIRDDRIFPVLYASGLRNVGADHLLDFFQAYAPCPLERPGFPVKTPAMAIQNDSNGRNMGLRKIDDALPPALYVYKTMVDPFAGRISFFKVISGCIKNDASLENYARSEVERLSHLCIMQGRRMVEVSELHAGDLGAVAKLRVTQTGDTLGAKGQQLFVEPAGMPEPAMTYAIEPKTRADEDKLAPALHKLMEEDLFLRFYRDPQTNEFLLAGAGQPHIEAVVSKLKRRYHTEVILKAPKVPYRETIRASAQGHGRHKKQSGGHGQFGDCTIRIEPLPRGRGFEFVDDIFGGAIPRQFIPAVEKGVQEAAARGHIAGYPVVDFRVTLIDGSYHDVDSSEMSFKIAGRLAFRKCMEQARPALLEPIMHVEVEAPNEFAGTLLGDLNSRRGRVQGMEASGMSTTVKAEVPMSEMLSYGTALTSMTQGRGSFRMEMDHYSIAPAPISEKIIAEARRPSPLEVED